MMKVNNHTVNGTSPLSWKFENLERSHANPMLLQHTKKVSHLAEVLKVGIPAVGLHPHGCRADKSSQAQ